MSRNFNLVICCLAVLLGPLASVLHDVHADTEHHNATGHVCELFSGLGHFIEHDDSDQSCCYSSAGALVTQTDSGRGNPSTQPDELTARSPPLNV